MLPAHEPDVVRLRPLTGADHESIGLFLPLEIAASRRAPSRRPTPDHSGDATGGLLLFDAARLNLRNGAAPFRSLSRIAVTPRPCQFVPLIMALRLDSVRLLIADDVGVGKTVEAAMIAASCSTAAWRGCWTCHSSGCKRLRMRPTSRRSPARRIGSRVSPSPLMP